MVVVVASIVSVRYCFIVSHVNVYLYIMRFFQSEVKNNEVLNSATQMTPRTLDGMKTRQVPRGSVLPIGINPRAGILLPPCIYTSTM